MRAFLDVSPLTKASVEHAEFFRGALQELRAARSRGLLNAGPLDPSQLAQDAGNFTRYTDPQTLIDAEWKVIERTAGEMRGSCPHLYKILVARTSSGRSPSLLAVAVRYYFRREVETDQQLFNGLAFAKFEALQENQDRGFRALTEALTRQGQRLDELLSDVIQVVGQIRTTTSDTNARVRGLEEQIRKLLEHLQLQNREVRPSDSLSVRSEVEQQRVRQVVGEYRSLPEDCRRQRPELLNEVGKLEVAAGDFEAAQQDFKEAASRLPDPRAQAEAHHNAYRAALERQQWSEALDELRQAAKLDPSRFAPFPLERYEPQRILGAGGFGVVFLCQDPYLNKPLVVKSLMTSELARNISDVFAEARALEDLNHPGIIRLRYCDYADAARTRPYIVMDYFEGQNLAEYVINEGRLSPTDLLEIARPVADALQAAHAKGILHRDVKAGNLLIRRDGERWRVKLIDFGLALRPAALEGKASTQSPQAHTTTGRSIAGTLHYAAPEQMGQLPGVPVGPYSDVYGFGRTCYYALLGIPEPDDGEKEELPDAWRRLLSRCTRRTPEHRFSDFTVVLAGLTGIEINSRPPAVSPPVVSPPVVSPPVVSPPAVTPHTVDTGVRIFGFAPTTVLHWMGKEGWKFEEARKAIDALGAGNLKESTVRTCLTVGRNPKYSKPAPVTAEQAKKLYEAAGRQPTIKVSSGEEKPLQKGLKAPQIRILNALAAAREPLDRDSISQRAPCPLAFVIEYIGGSVINPEREARRGWQRLIPLGFVEARKRVVEGKSRRFFEITDAGRQALASVLDQSPKQDEANSHHEQDGREMKKTYEANLQDLIAAGLLSPPLRLFRKYKGKLLKAKLLPNGKVVFEGQTFNTSSKAAGFALSTVTGREMQANGWSFWQYRDAHGNTATLFDAREKLLAKKDGLVGDDEGVSDPTDRAYWESKGTKETLLATDALFKLVKEVEPKTTLNYLKYYIGIEVAGSPRNFVTFIPRKSQVIMHIKLPQSKRVDNQLTEAGIDKLKYDAQFRQYRVKSDRSINGKQRAVLLALIRQAWEDFGK